MNILLFFKWAIPFTAFVASIAFAYTNMPWASGFAAGACLVMLEINVSENWLKHG